MTTVAKRTIRIALILAASLTQIVASQAQQADGPVSFAGKRIVVFSGGEAKDLDGVYEEVRGIRDGGGNGSIIGRNTFQRPKEKALEMLNKIIEIYKNGD